MTAHTADVLPFMRHAIDQARQSMQNGFGGPFGACIVRNGELIATGTNTVLRDNDPTAHAEINAIRAAAGALRTFRLDDCLLVCTCEPCPMCLGAIYWARIPHVYFGCNRTDAAHAGFDDQVIYNEFIRPPHDRTVTFHDGVARDDCRQLLKSWANLPNKQPY